MADQGRRRFRWTAQLMMTVSIVVVCFVVPLGFILAGQFAGWLRAVGVHASPNLADGYLVAEFASLDHWYGDADANPDVRGAREALAIRKFSIKKVAFRPLSGIGIAPRFNLCFEFDGRLPDPHNSGRKFSATAIHVYLKAPGKTAAVPKSDRLAGVGFDGPAWNYQVIIDGLHDQARIFDPDGSLVGRGLGLYVRHEELPADAPAERGSRPAVRTLLTAALPMGLLGDPAVGEWQAYVLVGLTDSRHPSMLLKTGPGGTLPACSGAFAGDSTESGGGRLRLRALTIRPPA